MTLTLFYDVFGEFTILRSSGEPGALGCGLLGGTGGGSPLDTCPAAAADASPSRHYRYSTAKSSDHSLTEYN